MPGSIYVEGLRLSGGASVCLLGRPGNLKWNPREMASVLLFPSSDRKSPPAGMHLSSGELRKVIPCGQGGIFCQKMG